MISLKEGDKAPGFTGIDQDGNKISLSSYKGKKLVLFFYPEADTPTCTIQSCNLRDNYSLLRQHDIEVLGVSPDNAGKQKNFEQKFQRPFKLVADEKNKVTELYGVRDWKKMFGHDYIGILRTTFLLDEKGTILKIFRKPKNKEHAEEILRFLKSIQG
jgi:peroxiredoxin Q/BCP